MRLLACLALFTALLGSSPALAATGPSIALSAPSAAPLASLVVTGARFSAGASLTISIDGVQVASATADGAGAFAAIATIPSQTALGRHVLEVADAARSGVFADATLVVAVTPAQVVERAFASTALDGQLRLAVYLPPGYAAGAKRYPVIYFLHGLPGGDLSYRSWGTFVAQSMRKVGTDAIVVVPQAARLTDPDPEYHDWGLARDWETALAAELPRYVDASFRTIADRRGRALIGVSAGGYGAFIVGLHHLDAFSAIESWSGYFEPTDPAGDKKLDLGSPGENANADATTFVPALPAALGRRPTFFGFYVGRGDGRFRPANVSFHKRLLAAAVPHAFAVYPGGHEMAVWSSHAALWLGLALSHLEAPN